MSKLIEEIITKTHEYLQPNPATRARLATLNTFNKIQGKGKAPPYPQPEGQLGDCMLKYGNELDRDSLFGKYLHCCRLHFVHGWIFYSNYFVILHSR